MGDRDTPHPAAQWGLPVPPSSDWEFPENRVFMGASRVTVRLGFPECGDLTSSIRLSLLLFGFPSFAIPTWMEEEREQVED